MNIKLKKSIVLFAIIFFFAWLAWDNNRICVSHYVIKNNLLPSTFNGYKIVHISDLHNASFGVTNNRLVDKIAAVEPDIIAITGDLFDANHTNIDVGLCFVKEVIKIAPVYYVTGNHEAWIENYGECIKPQLEALGVVVLEDERMSLEKDGQKIALMGLDDPDIELNGDLFGEAEAMIDTKLERIESSDFCILLSHRPELFSIYVKHSISCVLTGHAHGGQFRIPFVGGVIAPNQGLFPKYTAGIVSKENTQMIISRGLGESIIPIRINNCPELVVVELTN